MKIFLKKTEKFFTDFNIDEFSYQQLTDTIELLDSIQIAQYLEYLDMYIYKVFSNLSFDYNYDIFTRVFQILLKIEKRRFNTIEKNCFSGKRQSLITNYYHLKYQCQLKSSVDEICSKMKDYAYPYNDVFYVDVK